MTKNREQIIAKMSRTKVYFEHEDCHDISVSKDARNAIYDFLFVLPSSYNAVGRTIEEIQETEQKEINKRLKARERRQAMNDVADSLGLKRVRGAVSGRTYYE